MVIPKLALHRATRHPRSANGRATTALMGSLLAFSLCGAMGVYASPAAAASPTLDNEQLVIRVADGAKATDVANRYNLTLVEPLLRSRNLWLAQPNKPGKYPSQDSIESLADTIADSSQVAYAERYVENPVGDRRIHAWPHGDPRDVNLDSTAAWRNQPAAQALGLPLEEEDGKNVLVAVLDTGASSQQAPNASQVIMGAGYDYVDDDNDASEGRQGRDTNLDGEKDGAYGHGTFVAGQVSLVAPAAEIVPYRVLDSDGVGNVYVIAEAIDDAVDAGAAVINMSFGSEDSQSSRVLNAAFARAANRGVVIVAAAGNVSSSQRLYPGDADYILSVTCADPQSRELAGFASYGWWVDVAAPCEGMLGALPEVGSAVWSGTSFSAPLVAGQAALIRSRYPKLSRLGVVRAIKGTANCDTSPRLATGTIRISASIKNAASYGEAR